MAVIDEASVKITPDTSGFAEELRGELEAEISAATAGLDNTIHLKVDVDSDAARGKLRQAMDDFTTDGSNAFGRLKADEQDLFNDISQNAEKSRVKQTTEQTKLRDKLKALWQPAVDKLKKEQVDEKVRLDQITTSATKAAKAVGDSFGGQNSGAVKAQQELAKAYRDTEKAASELSKAQGDLVKAHSAEETAAARAEAAEQRLSAAMSAGQRAVDNVQAAEKRLDDARATGNTEKTTKAEQDLQKAREALDRSTATASEQEARVSAARAASAASSERVATAEDRVSTARDKSSASTTRAEEAERRLATAHDNTAKAADRSTASHGRLSAATEKLRGHLRSLADDGNRTGNVFTRLGGFFKSTGDKGGILSSIMSGMGSVMNGVGNVTSLASGALNKLEGSLDDASKSAGSFITSVIQMGAQLTSWILIGEAVTFVVGAIGAAIAGLPALLGAAVAGFVVFKLGMDGIKNAYNSALKPALDQLKKQISEVFEKGLTPVFRDLAQHLIPAVTQNLKGLAQGFVDVAAKIEHVLTTQEGLNNIKGIIDKTATAVRALGQPLADLTQKFLELANTGTILQNMVGIIQDLVTNVGNWMDQMARSGDAERAVAALRTALDATEKAVLKVLTAAINFFTAAAPGFDHLVTSVGDVASKLVGDLGPAFGQVMDAAGRMIDRVPQSVWDGLKQAIHNVSQALSDFADSGAFTQIVQGVTDIVNVFATFVEVVGWIANVTGAINDLRNGVGDTNPTLRSLADRINDVIPGSAALDRAMGQNVDSLGHIIPPADAAGHAIDGVGDAAGQLPGATRPPMTDTAGIVEDSMQRAQDAARAGGTGTAGGWRAGIDPLPANTQVTFDSLPRNIQDAMVGSEAAARTGSDLVKTAVETGFNSAADQAQIAMGRISSDTSTQMATTTATMAANLDAMKVNVQTATTEISTAWTTMATNFSTEANIMATSMQKAGRDALNMQTTMTGAFTGIQLAAQGASDTLSAAFQKISTDATNASTTVQNAMKDMATAVQNALTTMSTAFSTSFTQISTTVTTSMTEVKTTITTTMQQNQQLIQQTLQVIQQNWQQTWQQVVQITQQTWNQINQAIQQGGEQALQQCRTIAQNILQVFKDLAGPMEAAGRTMMERLAAGITAGGAAAVAAARNVAAQIKAQFPASPAKEGPLSGRGDPLRTGGVIIQRLADGMHRAQSYLVSRLVPIMNATANLLASPVMTTPTSGWTITSSTASSSSSGDSPAPLRLLSTPSSAPNERWWEGQPGQRDTHGGAQGGGSHGMNPDDLRAALEGLVIRIDDRGNGLAKIVNSQNRTLARR